MAIDQATAATASPTHAARAPERGRRRRPWQRRRGLRVGKVRIPGETLIVLEGTLVAGTVDAFVAAVERIGGRAQLVIDLSGVSRIDRAGVAALTAACDEHDGSDVRLVGADDRARRRIRRHAARLNRPVALDA